jgi:hypothetical protein
MSVRIVRPSGGRVGVCEAKGDIYGFLFSQE